MPSLLEIIAGELERPRTLPPQVAKHLSSAHGVSLDGISEFFIHQLPKLEDFEMDLLLSPVFTPTLADQAIVAEHLGCESIAPDQWPALVSALEERPTHAHLLGEETPALEVPLREVTLERYVHRLRLQGSIPKRLFDLILSLSPASDHPMFKAVARRAAWGSAARLELLTQFLTSAPAEHRAPDAMALLSLVETYEPADIAELLARLPHWQDVLRHEIGLASGPKPFFNDRVEDLHGGGRDQRRTQDARITAKHGEAEFLIRLKASLSM